MFCLLAIGHDFRVIKWCLDGQGKDPLLAVDIAIWGDRRPCLTTKMDQVNRVSGKVIFGSAAFSLPFHPVCGYRTSKDRKPYPRLMRHGCFNQHSILPMLAVICYYHETRQSYHL